MRRGFLVGTTDLSNVDLFRHTDAVMSLVRGSVEIGARAVQPCLDLIECAFAHLRLRAGCPGHPRLVFGEYKTWMPATSAGMTTERGPTARAAASRRACRRGPWSSAGRGDRAWIPWRDRGPSRRAWACADPLPACGERVPSEARRVRGTLRHAERVEYPPHPDPLPASGERENARRSARPPLRWGRRPPRARSRAGA